MMLKSRTLIGGWLVLMMFCSFAIADVKLPSIFQSHMVLQRQQPIVIWGWADRDESVTVTLADQTQSTKADVDGRWRVSLAAMEAGGPHALLVEATNRIELKNVLIGEVWLCSGQSNMVWAVARSHNHKDTLANANDKQLRLFQVKARPNRHPQVDFSGAWRTADQASVKQFSGVGYFFGRKLREELNVPVGLIQSAVGGTPVQSWTSRDAMLDNKATAFIVERFDEFLKTLGERQAKYQEQLEAWKQRVKAAAAQGKKKPVRPRPPTDYSSSRAPTSLFNSYIHPLVPLSMRGVIWYQGEANKGAGELYSKQFPLMIEDWRSHWNRPDMPFLFVQLAGYRLPQTDPNESAPMASIREAQRQTLMRVPNTGMAVAIDVGDRNTIHPKNKYDVGLRLARWALHDLYGRKDIVPSGPLFKKMAVQSDGSVRIWFDHVGGGLVVKGGELKTFALAGKDGVFHWATARVDGATVVVRCDKVSKPVSVRYGYANLPPANLYNAAGLPASPFRTDAW